jgi:hypothetical protein
VLASSRVRGTVVSSDSVGLTRLSREEGLFDILAHINRPKELVHAFGVAIGARAIGIWAADNTQMFYPADVPASTVVSMLLALQERVATDCKVLIGLGVHIGEYFELGGGLYGPDADRVERLAEDFTSGGEVAVTDTVREELEPAAAFQFLDRPDVPQELGRVYRVVAGPVLRDLSLVNFEYPIPYTPDFYEGLASFGRGEARRSGVIGRQDKFLVKRAVVLIHWERDTSAVSEVAVLSDLAAAVAVRHVATELLQRHPGEEIKLGGTIGIYTFVESRDAVEFAMQFKAALAEREVGANVGVDYGDVLIFPLAERVTDIAGMPVNVASKLAQDCGQYGHVYVTDAAARLASIDDRFRPVTLAASGVTIAAFEG